MQLMNISNEALIVVLVWDISLFTNVADFRAESVQRSTDRGSSPIRQIVILIENLGVWKAVGMFKIFAEFLTALAIIGSSSLGALYIQMSSKQEKPRRFDTSS